MFKVVVRVLGAMVTSYVGIGLIIGSLAAMGFSEQLWASYVALSWAAAAAGVVVSVLLLLYAHYVGGVPFRAFSFAWNRRDTLVMVSAVLVTLLAALGYMLLLHQLGVRSLTLRPLHWSVIVIGLIRAVGTFHEEVLSRGYVLPLLSRRYRLSTALVMSAVIFMLMHLPTRGISFLIPTWLLAGFVYGYVYLKSGSLWVAAAVHAAHNWGADLFLYSDLAPSVFAFAPGLGILEKTVFEVILSLLMLGLIYLGYGRHTPLLEPSHRLHERWIADRDKRDVVVQPVPA